METGRHASLGTRPQVGGDGVGVQIAGSGVVRGIPVRLMQPGRTRSQGAVDEQVTGQPGRAGVVENRARLRRAAHRLAPVADHLDAGGPGAQGPQFAPIVQSADLGTGAFVHRDDAGRCGGSERREPGFGQLRRGVMGVAD